MINEVKEQKREKVLLGNCRGTAAHQLALMAIEHSSSSAEAAASLLLGMEHGSDFNFQLLLKFDAENRALADLVMLGYKPHEIWPSKWISEAGFDGESIMQSLREKWAHLE